MTRVLSAVLIVVLAIASAAPAAADEGYVDLFVTANLDAPAYLPSDVDTMRLDITILNQGTAPATGVVVRSEGNVVFAPWGDLEESGPGIELDAGRSMTFALTAKTSEQDMAQRFEVVSAEADRNPADNRDTVEAFLTEKQADLTVIVHYDADRDAVIDAGETRSGVMVALAGGLSWQNFSARTDAAGVAHFPGITGGEYTHQISTPHGWYTNAYEHVKVRGRTNAAVIRATYNNLSALVPTIVFDRDTYAPGDMVRERVTLTNTGATDIVGVVANCGQPGIKENVLSSLDWGELASIAGNPGVVVRAGETRTWEFTVPLPPRAWEYGYISLRCYFAPVGWHNGSSVADVRAAVPGGFGTMAGTLVDESGTTLSGITLLMINTVTGAVAARAESDGAGRFQFPEMPADLYELRPVGPWRLRDVGLFPVQVMAMTPHDYTVVLIPGPTWHDPDEPPPTTPVSTVDAPTIAPKPQASVRPANLADTGADVVDLTVLGVLLVLVGAGLVLVRRRPA
ncbi:carboxypeptidase-like regulatory domain-containing protein [Actinophytocola sp.]|uniref:carboxypeptidase-like regulatory domain-containing protein n=1 Tax=Actinophytocola sp. TaxID=1872138 RepID=UPI002ED2FA1E